MKTLLAVFFLLAVTVRAATYTTEASAGSNPPSGNTMYREKVVKLHLLAPAAPGATNYFFKFNGETSGSWVGSGSNVTIAHGQPEVVITMSGLTEGLQPWGAGQSVGYRWEARSTPAGVAYETRGFTVKCGPFNATAGNGDYPGWGWDAAEVAANTVHLYLGGPPPETAKPLKIRFNYDSWCPDPHPLTIILGDGQTHTFTPASGTKESPSGLRTETWDVQPGAVVGGVGNWVGVKTETGAFIKGGHNASGSYAIWPTGHPLAGYPMVIDPDTYFLKDMSAITIACDPGTNPPPPESNTTTDGSSGAVTQTTSQGGSNTTTGPTAGGGTTSTDTITTQPPADPVTGEQPPSTTYKDQKTQYLGTGNPNSGDMKKQDFYDVTKQALKDAGNSGAAPTSAASATLEDISQSDKGVTEDVQGKMESAETKVSDIKTTIEERIRAINLNSVPTSLGTVSSLEFASFDLGSNHTRVTLDLSGPPWGNAVSIFRGAVLFGITIVWVILSVQTVKSTFS